MLSSRNLEATHSVFKKRQPNVIWMLANILFCAPSYALVGVRMRLQEQCCLRIRFFFHASRVSVSVEMAMS